MCNCVENRIRCGWNCAIFGKRNRPIRWVAGLLAVRQQLLPCSVKAERTGLCTWGFLPACPCGPHNQLSSCWWGVETHAHPHTLTLTHTNTRTHADTHPHTHVHTHAAIHIYIYDISYIYIIYITIYIYSRNLYYFYNFQCKKYVFLVLVNI